MLYKYTSALQVHPDEAKNSQTEQVSSKSSISGTDRTTAAFGFLTEIGFVEVGFAHSKYKCLVIVGTFFGVCVSLCWRWGCLCW